MRRREFVVGFCAVAAWPFAGRAEQVKTYRVGLLAGWQVGEGEERRKAIKEVLAENGFVEGRNLQFEARWGDPLAENVEALKAAKVDVSSRSDIPPHWQRKHWRQKCRLFALVRAIQLRQAWPKVLRILAAI